MTGNKLTLYERLGYNPLVLRAFRTGFRSGPGNFRIGIWAILLLAVIGIVSAINYYERVTLERGASVLGRTLLIYITAVFLFGGVQRMIASLSSERERGTFDFLHLSTLPPRAIIWGMMLAGHLPGYLLLTILAPLIFVAGWFAGWHLGYLALMLVELVGLVVFLSLIFQFIGFWTKKASDLRTLALLLFLLLATVTSVFATQYAPLHLITFASLLRSTYGRATEGDVIDLSFFGDVYPLELLVPVFFAPLAVVVYRSLAHCLRYRERKPVSTLGGCFLVAWVQLFLLGAMWDTVPAHVLSFISVVVTWIWSSALLRSSTRPSEGLLRLCWTRFHHGTVPKSESPAYWLLAGLAVILVVCAAAPYALSPTRADDAWLPLLVVPVFLIGHLYQQWLQLIGYSQFRWVGLVWSILLIWMPLFGILVGENRPEVGVWIGCITPIGHTLLLAGIEPKMLVEAPHYATIATLQGVYFLVATALIVSNRMAARRLLGMVSKWEEKRLQELEEQGGVDSSAQFAETTAIGADAASDISDVSAAPQDPK